MDVEVVAAAVVRHGQVLAARRTYPQEVAGRWELPGGKCEPAESPAEAVVREVAEELGCEVSYVRPLAGRVPIRPGLVLTAHVVRLVAGEPHPRDHDELQWLGPEELDDVDWLEPDRPFLDELRGILLDGEPLTGGGTGGAVRIGGTVRRPTGPWTPAVHALLDHLTDRGVPGVPRVLGTDERGREVLTYAPGRVIDVDSEQVTDAAVVDFGRWMRRVHDAARDFRHPGPWRNHDRPLRAGEIVCHHDAAPYNVALDDDLTQVRGVFDWDMAGPSTPVEDLAFSAWTWVPLFRPVPAEDCARRLALLAEGYAAPEVTARTVLDAVPARLSQSVEAIAAGQRRGDPGMLALRERGEPDRTARRIEDLGTRLPQIRAALPPGSHPKGDNHARVMRTEGGGAGVRGKVGHRHRHRATPSRRSAMPSLRVHLHEESDADELVEALTLAGYGADRTTERFAGDDDDEDVVHVVTTDAPAPEVDDLLGDTDAYIEASDPMSGTVAEVANPADLPEEPKKLKGDPGA